MTGIVKELSSEDRNYYTCREVMALLGIGRTKASNIMSNLNRKLMEKGIIEDDYPRGRVPKIDFDRGYRIGEGGAR